MPALRRTPCDRRAGVCMPFMPQIIAPNKTTLVPAVWSSRERKAKAKRPVPKLPEYRLAV